MAERVTRSSHYQHLILERSHSNEMMSSFCNEDSIYGRLNPFEYDEKLLDLEDELKREFWRVVDECLTERQKEVIKLYADGYTQMEIGKLLNINQSSVVKNFLGNTQYYKYVDEDGKKQTVKKTYGGTHKKLNKVIESDEKIIDILKRITELRAEKW